MVPLTSRTSLTPSFKRERRKGGTFKFRLLIPSELLERVREIEGRRVKGRSGRKENEGERERMKERGCRAGVRKASWRKAGGDPQRIERRAVCFNESRYLLTL